MVAATRKSLLHRTLEHRAQMLEGESGRAPRRHLREIREAMERLDTEAFGFCEACYMTIPWGELMECPERRTCDRCTPAAESA